MKATYEEGGGGEDSGNADHVSFAVQGLPDGLFSNQKAQFG
jgi:hypothetical protein